MLEEEGRRRRRVVRGWEEMGDELGGLYPAGLENWNSGTM